MKVILARHGATEGTAARRYSGAGTDEPLSAAGIAALRATWAAGSLSQWAAASLSQGDERGAARLAKRQDAGAVPCGALGHVYTSGMVRCEQTADVLFPGVAQIPVSGLREMNFGAFEGKSFSDLKDDADYRAWVEAMCEPACPGGESKQTFTDRCVRAFRQVLAEEVKLVGSAARGEYANLASFEGVSSSDAADATGAVPVAADPVVFVVHAGTIRALLSEIAQPAMEYFSIETKPGGAWACTWDGRALRGVTPHDDAMSALCASAGEDGR